MSIDARCKEQRPTADRMAVAFKSTAPGSKQQAQALMSLSFLVGMWADFLSDEARRMDKALALETCGSAVTCGESLDNSPQHN